MVIQQKIMDKLKTNRILFLRNNDLVINNKHGQNGMNFRNDFRKIFLNKIDYSYTRNILTI